MANPHQGSIPAFHESGIPRPWAHPLQPPAFPKDARGSPGNAAGSRDAAAPGNSLPGTSRALWSRRRLRGSSRREWAAEVAARAQPHADGAISSSIPEPWKRMEASSSQGQEPAVIPVSPTWLFPGIHGVRSARGADPTGSIAPQHRAAGTSPAGIRGLGMIPFGSQAMNLDGSRPLRPRNPGSFPTGSGGITEAVSIPMR